MKKSRNFTYSLVKGILWALVLVISINFPNKELSAVSATVDALPTVRLSIFLDHLQVAFNSGYGIVSSLLAVIFTWFFLQQKSLCQSDIKINKEKRSIAWIIVSALFGCINTAGMCMYYLDSLVMFYSIDWFLICCFLSFGYASIFYTVSKIVSHYLEKGVCEEHIESGSQKKYFLKAFIVILLCWSPWIISYYPASMDNDVFAQLWSAMGDPSNDHPWLSSCLLGYFYNIGKFWFNNDNAGIFLYVFIRDLIIAAIYSGGLVCLRNAGVKRFLRIAVLLFYALTPVWGAYAKHAFKDTFGIGLFALYFMMLVLIVRQYGKNQAKDVKLYFGYAISGLYACLFRNNFISVIAPITIILIVYVLVKGHEHAVKRAVALFSLIVMYFLISELYFNLLEVKKGSITEAMSLPIQQIARTVKNHYDDLAAEELEQVQTVGNPELMCERYDPVLSDPVKGLYNAAIYGREDTSEILTELTDVYLTLLKKYPVDCLEAAVAQSYGYYCFTPNLPEQSGNWNSGMTIFDWIGCNGDFDEQFDFHYLKWSDIPRQILHQWAKVYDHIPILSLTDTCAAYTWLIVIIGFIFIKKKQTLNFLPILCLQIMIINCVASPVNDCFRYYAPIAASTPMLLLLL